MTKKEIFKGLATVLLLPGGFIVAAILAVALAILLAVAACGALFFAAASWIASSARAFLENFGKAARANEADDSHPCPESLKGAGLPDETLRKRSSPEAWLQ